MPAAGDFQLAQVQAVIFTPEVEKFLPSRIFQVVFEKYADRFTGSPVSLPIPLGALPDVPRVVLRSADEVWKLEGAPSRISSTWSRPAPDVRLEAGEAAAACAGVLVDYVTETSARVWRMGCIVTRAFETPEPPQVLIQRFCNEEAALGAFRGSQTFEVHNHKRYVLTPFEDVRVNSWVRLKTGFVDSETRRAIIMEQDLNTLAQEQGKRRFEPVQVRRFFAAAAAEADSILRRYFGENQG